MAIESTEHEVALFGGEVFYVRIESARKESDHNSSLYPQLRVSTTPKDEWYDAKDSRRFITIRGRKYASEYYYLRLHGKWKRIFRVFEVGLYNESGLPLQSGSGIPGKVDAFVTDALSTFMDMVPDWEVRSLILERQDEMQSAMDETEKLRDKLKVQEARYNSAWREVRDELSKRLEK